MNNNIEIKRNERRLILLLIILPGVLLTTSSLRSQTDLKEVFTIETENILVNDIPISDIRDVKVGKDGNIYALDSRNFRIIVFNSEGVVTGAFGRQGEGPGEFRQPVHMELSEEGNLYVLDGALNRITAFTPDGQLLTTKSIKIPRPSRFIVIDDKIFVTSFTMFLQSDTPIIHLNEDGAPYRSFGTLSDEIDKMAIGGESGRFARFSNTLLYAHPYPYLIEEYSPTGERIKAITRDHPDFQPPESPKRDGEMVRIDTPPVTIKGLGVSGNSDLIVYVFRIGEAPQIDIFSNEGNLLNTHTLPEEHRFGCVSGNKLYTFISGRGKEFPVITKWVLE